MKRAKKVIFEREDCEPFPVDFKINKTMISYSKIR